MHRHQLRAVGEGGFDLNVRDHLWHAVHHVVAREDRRPVAHELRDRSAIAGPFHDRCGDQRDGFGIVELEAARPAPLCEQRRREDEQLVFFAGREVHERSLATVN